MAYTAVFKSPTKQQQVTVQYNPQNGQVTANVIETWIVETDTSEMLSPLALVSSGSYAPGLPVAGLVYGGLICVRVQPQAVASTPYGFEVQVEYQLPPPAQPSTPLNVKVSVASLSYQSTVYYDKDGNPIVNSAGMPFDPQPQNTFFDQKITVSWDGDASTIAFAALTAAQGKVNSDTVSISCAGYTNTWQPRTLKLTDAQWSISGPTVVLTGGSGPTQLWHADIEMVAHTDGPTCCTICPPGGGGCGPHAGYYANIVDNGFCVLDQHQKPTNATDEYGSYLNAPVQLDGSGNQLPFGNPPKIWQYPIEFEASFMSFLSGIV